MRVRLEEGHEIEIELEHAGLDVAHDGVSDDLGCMLEPGCGSN